MNIRIETWLGHEIRFVEKEPGDWWAIASDVTKALGIKNTSLAINGSLKKKAKGLRDYEKGVCKLYTLGGEQEVLIINEPGIYRLIFRSNKPEAEEFQDWVFSIIQTLRKSSGLEGFQIFRMLDKSHQREAMDRLNSNLAKPAPKYFIKANTIANKTVSTMYGYPKMLKKDEMTPDMLVPRQEILDETVNLMALSEKFNLGLSISKTVQGKYLN